MGIALEASDILREAAARHTMQVCDAGDIPELSMEYVHVDTAGKASGEEATRGKSMFWNYRHPSHVGSLLIQPAPKKTEVKHSAVQDSDDVPDVNVVEGAYVDSAGKASGGGATRGKGAFTEYRRSSQVGALLIQPVGGKTEVKESTQVCHKAAGKLDNGIDLGKRVYASPSDALNPQPSSAATDFAGKQSGVTAPRGKGASEYNPTSEIGEALRQPVENTRRTRETQNSKVSVFAGRRSGIARRVTDKKPFQPRGTQVGLSVQTQSRYTECPPNMGVFVLPGDQFGDEPALILRPTRVVGRKHFEQENVHSSRVLPSGDEMVLESTSIAAHKVLNTDNSACAGRRMNVSTVQGKRCVSSLRVEDKQTFSSRGKKTFKRKDSVNLLQHPDERLPSNSRSVRLTSEVPAGVHVSSVRGKKMFPTVDSINLDQIHTPKSVLRAQSVDASLLDPAGQRITTATSKRMLCEVRPYRAPTVRCKMMSYQDCPATQDSVQGIFSSDLPNNPQSTPLELLGTRVAKRVTGKRHF